MVLGFAALPTADKGFLQESGSESESDKDRASVVRWHACPCGPCLQRPQTGPAIQRFVAFHVFSQSHGSTPSGGTAPT